MVRVHEGPLRREARVGTRVPTLLVSKALRSACVGRLSPNDQAGAQRLRFVRHPIPFKLDSTDFQDSDQNRTLAHFEIPADDPDRLAEFYTRLFQWTVRKEDRGVPYWSLETAPPGEGVYVGARAGSAGPSTTAGWNR